MENGFIPASLLVILSFLIATTSMLVIQKSLQLGEMMAILTLIGSILPAVASLALTNLQLQQASVAFERMYEYAQNFVRNMALITISKRFLRAI